MKCSLRLFGRVFLLRFAVIKSPKLEVGGLTSRCSDNKHVLFLDYDQVGFDRVMADLESLSAQCSHFFVFTTWEEEDDLGVYGNYHVICADKFDYGEVPFLLQKTHTDDKHKRMVGNTRYRAWVLRFTGKGARAPPRFVCFKLGNKPVSSAVQSDAHIGFIKKLHQEIPGEIEGVQWNGDGLFDLTLTHYKTNKESPE